MRVAAIDLGTNTFLCLVADVRNQKIEKVISDTVKVVRLGQGVHANKKFHVEALARADECLGEFAKEIAKHKVDKIVACATSAARDVSNGEELLKIGRKHGINIEIISGEREAECTFWGTVGREVKGSVGIIDVGGGSTEFMVGDARGITKKVSVDVGSVRLTELFITQHPVPSDELDKVREYLRTKLQPVENEFKNLKFEKVIAVAGTPTTIAAIDMGKPFDAESVHGYSLPLTRLDAWTKKLAAMNVEARQKISGMDPKRADVIVAGAAVLSEGCKALGTSELEVSIQGLRYGIALLAGEQK
jgi:exopolyphosphatase / guanosine-5'-triphosphate,3'-diphosphate pyrophosphatase